MVITTSKYVPWWEELLVGLFTFGLGNAIIEIIVACIENSVSSAIAATGISPESMGYLVVRWPDQSRDRITDGGLLDNFYMRGQ